jgi:hypothetical protein
MFIYEKYIGSVRADTEIRIRYVNYVEFLEQSADHSISVSEGTGDRLPVASIQTRQDLLKWLVNHPSEVLSMMGKPSPHSALEIELATYLNKSKGKELVDKNLKTAAAVGKPGISAVPVIAFVALGEAMADGAKKYGAFNWRDTGVTASVFEEAIFRHFMDYFGNRNDYAKDSGIHHLAHLMASCAILLDAQVYGMLNDDRDNVDQEIDIYKMVETIRNYQCRDTAMTSKQTVS